MYKIFLITLLCFLFFSTSSYAINEPNFYLGTPYLANPLGEGEASPYAPGPLYREDGFDCTTYVEAIIAKLTQENSADFMKKIIKLRYINSKIDFFQRAHLMEYQWIPNAIAHDFIDEYPIKNVKNAHSEINLRQWFLKNKLIKNKDKQYLDLANKQKALAKSSVPYVLVSAVTNEFLRDFPEYMVVFFLKKIPANSWDGQEKEQNLITHMGILHMGMLYHASLRHKKVVRLSLVEYLKQSPNFIGVSFYKIN